MIKPTQSELLKLFDYDPVTGVVTRKITINSRAKAGAVVSRKASSGHIQVSVNNRLYMLHRLVWVMVHGVYPEGQIDHINRVRDDNRLCNLRVVTPAENMLNKSTYVSNWSGTPGVMWYAPGSKWVARISAGGKRKHLGYFRSIEAAKAAYFKAKETLHAI